ncbi:hypothetical protein A2U01_0073130, partial [Trifolium medium]|nr:hypothetical protein [Trifolium medium]
VFPIWSHRRDVAWVDSGAIDCVEVATPPLTPAVRVWLCRSTHWGSFTPSVVDCLQIRFDRKR